MLLYALNVGRKINIFLMFIREQHEDLIRQIKIFLSYTLKVRKSEQTCFNTAENNTTNAMGASTSSFINYECFQRIPSL